MSTTLPITDPSGLDALALKNLRQESLTALTVPIAVATMEAGFVGVVATKVFHVHPGLLALISAAPMFANLLSFAWARLSIGRRKVPFILGCQLSLIVMVAIVALLPTGGETGDAGAWPLAIAVVTSRLILSGLVTVRSTVWRLNYPRFRRGRVTSRLVLIASLTMMLASVGGSVVLDANPASFRVLYPAAALIACIGVIAFSRVRVPNETAHLAAELNGMPLEEEPGEGDDAENAHGAARAGIWSVLRDDSLFRGYMISQFALGVGNMMIQAPLIYLVSKQLQAGYFVSIGLIQVLPLLMMTLTMQFWGRYLDRVHVAEFRIYQSGVWMASHLATWLGALFGSIPLLALGRIVLGVGRGGGAVAWQIGHNDFAESHLATLYMGVHATLTGVRGAFAPFMGIALYLGWEARLIPGLGWEVPEFHGIGPWVFVLAAGFNAIAAWGFIGLRRRLPSPTEA